MIDINGDSIYIRNKNEKILYYEGKLYWAGTGKVYNGKAYDKNGNLIGFVSNVKDALECIRSGETGASLINSLENGSYTKDGVGANFLVQEGEKNGERGGLITWNKNDKLNDIPNQDGSYGRPTFIGLSHELGYSWDRYFGNNNFDNWYTTAAGLNATQSEKIATHWENRIRAEHGLPLKEFYSFDRDANGQLFGEEKGRLLFPGTRMSMYNTKTLGLPPLVPNESSL